jgi:type II secretory pathway component PulF
MRLGSAMSSSELLAFPGPTVAAVEAAEGTPRLADVLAAAAADDAEMDNRRATLWAALFPALLVVAVVGGVAGGILGSMRQRMGEVMASMETSSPAFEASATAGRVSGWIALGLLELLFVLWLVRRFPALTFGLPTVLRPVGQALPYFRGPARLAGATRMFRAMEPTVRAGLPLHESLAQSADAAGCPAVSDGAADAAARASAGAPIDDVAAALCAPASVRARFALAATRPPAEFAEALRALAADCAARHRDVLDARLRWVQPAATVLVGAIVLTQLLGVFAFLAAVRHAVPAW